MATSSLLGIDRAPEGAARRDRDVLGPSDSSDSGSDVTGLSEPDDGGPGAPLIGDDDIVHAATSPETVGRGSDSTGTGERRSAASDAGEREAADISPDRIVADPNRSDLRDVNDEAAGLDADLDEARAALLAAGAADEDEDEGEDEGGEAIEDEDADPVGTPVRRTRGVDDEGDDSVLLPRRR
jgi:hypothetical protein